MDGFVFCPADDPMIQNTTMSHREFLKGLYDQAMKAVPKKKRTLILKEIEAEKMLAESALDLVRDTGAIKSKKKKPKKKKKKTSSSS
mmetsp:Transcript_21040/g.34803  ORF Transcript_21040/g.34803 Transcript_21040/m.34803 type:complete len:87 (+) Transcript_21040:1173-1433(+)